MHIDPLGTSAWNTLIKGVKRWVLFPPTVDKAIAKGKGLLRPGENDEPAGFFLHVLPRIKAKYGESVPLVEVMQYPGETMFVPGGWWHAVLNVEDTIAVTQNFVSRTNFPHVWVKTRTGRRKMARKVRHRRRDVVLTRLTRAAHPHSPPTPVRLPSGCTSCGFTTPSWPALRMLSTRGMASRWNRRRRSCGAGSGGEDARLHEPPSARAARRWRTAASTATGQTAATART